MIILRMAFKCQLIAFNEYASALIFLQNSAVISAVINPRQCDPFTTHDIPALELRRLCSDLIMVLQNYLQLC